jgi:uncharacterized membrane protein YuzA (DUF378 family)
MKYLKKVAYLFIVVGGLNWGLVGMFQTDLVAKLLGDMTMASRLVYILVGISTLIVLITRCKCKTCDGSNCCH